MIFTVGHSTLSKEKFVELVQPCKIIVDVRSHPVSRTPHFNHNNLSWLEDHDIKYIMDYDLSGWTHRDLDITEYFYKYDIDIKKYAGSNFPWDYISQPVDEGWNVRSFYNYQFFMTLPKFFAAIERLLKYQDVGIMCCETLWWECHRSMIADYLTLIGIDVVHLQPKHTKHNEWFSERIEKYHEDVRELWNRQ